MNSSLTHVVAQQHAADLREALARSRHVSEIDDVRRRPPIAQRFSPRLRNGVALRVRRALRAW